MKESDRPRDEEEIYGLHSKGRRGIFLGLSILLKVPWT
jgi:hypothetical protein